ncbi:hypothetical protein C8Q75DRAFT_786820 [Abortiporus biennis]|nr:hypothetical protein C8Q75DRAFT_786820 [Abortiporus biennis]
MSLSPNITVAGKKKFAVYLILLLFDIIVLALAARVNVFQEFYFMADMFPLVLSAVTLVILFFMFLADFTFANSFTARPPFEIGMLYVLSIFWLAFNAFSTVRWSNIPLNCSIIPAEYAEDRAWCKDVQALKSFVWILFLGLFITATFTLTFSIIQYRKGNRQIWVTPLSRYSPHSQSNLMNHPAFNSNIRATMTDYFGATDGFGETPSPIQGQRLEEQRFNNWEKFPG